MIKRRAFISFLIATVLTPLISKAASILDIFRAGKKKSPLPPEGKFTPVKSLYIVDIKGVPKAAKKIKKSPEKFRLKIYGNVEEPFEISLDELKKMPYEIKDVILECVSNPPGGNQIGRIKVKGVRLSYLLEKAKMKKDSVDVVFKCLDGYHTSVEVDYVKEFEPLVVYEINHDEDGKVLGELTLDHGYPVRIICPEKWGYKSAKWVNKIKVVKYDYKGYWESQGWSDRARYKVDYFDL